ncbi:MAG: hypothetical protein ACT4QA_10885 [Panacagrimonas sp.]
MKNSNCQLDSVYKKPTRLADSIAATLCVWEGWHLPGAATSNKGAPGTSIRGIAAQWRYSVRTEFKLTHYRAGSRLDIETSRTLALSYRNPDTTPCRRSLMLAQQNC